MKRKEVYSTIAVFAFLLSCLTACSGGDRRVFGDDFDFPELTDVNTISFTANVTGEWRQLTLVASGGRMVVEWGDGRLQKIENPASHSAGVQYRYRNKGAYRVRVWAEEVDFLSVGDVLLSVSDLRLGNLPKVKMLTFNSLTNTRRLDLNTFCPNVEWINIGSCADLEELELDQCSRLKNIQIYTNPKLASLTFGNHPNVDYLVCSGNGLTSLSLKGLPALRTVDLDYNSELSHLELNENARSITALFLSQCAFQSLDDILPRCPQLNKLNCSFNRLTQLDLSRYFITDLKCDHNQLTSLVLREGSLLGYLYCHSNQLNTDALNALFTSLGEVPERNPQNPYLVECSIAFNNNPGAEGCNKEILLEKRWTLEEHP